MLSSNVPDADTLIALMSAWSCLPATKFHAAYPFFQGDRERTIRDYKLFGDDRSKLEATALLFAEYADEIYVAQGIETRSAIDAKRRGPKGESPVSERKCAHD